MHISFRTKVIIAFVLLSLIVSFVSLSLIYSHTVRSQMQDLKESLLMTAILGAELIDGDAHAHITLDRASINTTYYQYIKRKLNLIREANKKIRYVYTIVKNQETGRLFFAVDSADIEELFSYPGDRYESLNETDVVQAFEKPQVNKELIRDVWGAYMSGYAPIFDAQGKAVAVLGLDMSGETIDATRRNVLRNVVMIFICCILMSIVLGIILAVHLIRPIRSLVAGARRVGAGDLDHKVVISSHDEFGNLAVAFNTMAADLKRSTQQLKDSFFDTIRALTKALEAKDPYTKGHSERVMQYGIAIAKELAIPEEEITILRYLYIMHDIGKIGIDENILNKPGELSTSEREVISEHSAIGGAILEPISFLDKQLMQIVRSHHERPDGKGYPEGLTADEIPLSVAILTVADSFDAMVTDRPYRKAYAVDYAKKELLAHAGTQFNLDVVQAFIRVLERGDIVVNGEEGGSESK